jgi:hypothetical protein
LTKDSKKLHCYFQIYAGFAFVLMRAENGGVL